MEHPIKMDDLGVPPHLGNRHIYIDLRFFKNTWDDWFEMSHIFLMGQFF
jgi:hypothetical protein